jgi:glycosyltransferase involved in cell wall biosynthesis
MSYYKNRLKKPYVVSFHAEPFANAKDFLKTPFTSWTPQDFAHQVMELPLLSINVKRCFEKADHVVLCSFSAFEEFRAAYSNLDFGKVSVIQNAVDLQEIDTVDENQDVSENNRGLSVVFAGRLVWVKGLMCLLKAFELGKGNFKNFQLHIFGKGPEEGRLRKFVTSAKLDNVVRFHGRIPHNQLIMELKKADLVVVPSFHEAQSMFVLEAMACRKPVIAFDIPAMKEIIVDGQNGILAKSFDPIDLSEKIGIVLSDEDLRNKLGKNAYNYVFEKHNREKQVEQYLQVYENLLA